MKKLNLLFIITSILVATYFIANQSIKNENTTVDKTEEATKMPAPTNGETEVYDGQNEEEGGGGNAREEYEEAIHRTHDNVNWKAMDFRTKMKFYRKRQIKRSLRNSTSYANNNLSGTWEERGSNNNAGNMACIEYVQNGDKLFGISGGGTIWKGNLNGTGWTPQNEDLQFGENFLKAIPNGSGGHRLLAELDKVIWYSDDEGVTWTESLGFTFYDNWGSSREMITLNDANNNIYYLVKAWNTNPWGAVMRLYHSSDRGISFSEIFSIQQGNHDWLDIWAPENGNKGYLVVNGANLYELSGANVTLINSNNDLPTQNWTRLTGTDTGSGMVFYTLIDKNTVYKSTDNGANWTQTGVTPVNAWSVGMTASPNNPNQLYIGAVDCFRSSDSGATWTKVNSWAAYYGNNDLLHADIMDFEHGEKADGTDFILVGNHGGLHISYDNLLTTTNLGTAGLNIAQYYDVRTDPTSNAYLYAGSQDQGHQRSHLGNDTGVLDFNQVVSGDYGSSVFSENGTRFWTVYPGATIHYYPYPKTQTKKAQYSISGNHEAANGWIIPTAAVADPAENAIFIAGGNINGGDGSYLVKLTATSQSPWSVSAYQYDFDFRTNSNSGTATISAINASTIDAGRLYIGMSDGSFFYSNDNGTTWSQATGFSGPTQGWSSTMAIYSSKINSNEVWFAGNGYSTSAVYKSTNGGQTFTATDNGLPNTLVRDITANSDETLFFAATDVGPFVYVANENMWYEFMGAEAPQQSYRSVEYVSSIATVRFATYGRGVWDFKIDCNESIFYADADGDSFGDPNQSVMACSTPPGYVSDNTDCDDTNANLNPNTTEICDGIDNNCDGQIDEGYPSCTIISVAVSQGSDDAEEEVSTGDISLSSSDLELVYDGGDQIIGIRFNNINVPNGATITNAFIQFTTDEVTEDATNLTIVGENVDNASTFANTINNISNRPITSASIAWTPAPWSTQNEADFAQRTPDLSSVVNEIVNRSGWAANQSMAFIISGTGERTAESYNGTAAPILQIAYLANPCSPFFDDDNDGFCSDVDCDDTDASVNPNAEEVCDGIDNDCNGLIDDVSCTTPVVMENGLLNAVDDTWQVVNLQNTYNSPVIVATPVLPSKHDAPVVTRIRNAGATSFEIKLQSPGNTITATYQVHYVVVEEGIYNFATNGIDMEAQKVLSTKTAGVGSWSREAQSYANTYTNPVILGQVMTHNDANWSTFWTSGASRTNPPSATDFYAGKHAGGDPNLTRNDETIAYIVIEAGSHTMENLNFEAGLGADIVKGPNNTGYKYTLNMATPESAILSAAAIDGGDGGFPVLFTATPFGASEITMAFDEDQMSDTERNHTHEQVAYLVFGQSSSNLAAGNTDNTLPTTALNEQQLPQPVFEKEPMSIQLFPNPAQDYFQLKVHLSSNAPVDVFIANLQGKVLFEQSNVEVVGKYLEKRIEVSSFPNGVYWVTIWDGKEQVSRKWMKME